MPVLKVREDGKETVRQLVDDALTIGRAPTNGVVLQDPSASKEHCRIERIGGRWKVIDLESKNGTLVNGKFRNFAYLENGDVLKIGQAEIRFQWEGPARPAAAAPGRGAGAGVEKEPLSRLRKRPLTGSDIALRVSIASAGVLLMIVVFVSRTPDVAPEVTENRTLVENARRLTVEGRWDEAREYLLKNARPGTAGYEEWVEEELRRIEEQGPLARRAAANREAWKLFHELHKSIQQYHWGNPAFTAEGIARQVERMRREYADTDAGKEARRHFASWFAGETPARGSEMLDPARAATIRYRGEWDEALARSRQYEKESRFGDARETLERFLRTREAVLEAEDLEWFRDALSQQLQRLDLEADARFRKEQRRAADLAKAKRYDEAIAVWEEVAAKFNVEKYVRQAREEIAKLRAQKEAGR